jgi:hypothetical protein
MRQRREWGSNRFAGRSVTQRAAHLLRNAAMRQRFSAAVDKLGCEDCGAPFEWKGAGPKDAAVTLVTESAYFQHLTGG